MKKTVVTITGIRPDFIRMCFVFKELDKNFNHILIHTGQHYDMKLSEVFFKQLNIRAPDYILETGKNSSNHFEQLAYLTLEIPKLFEKNKIKPDLVLFLGDANTSGVAFPLKKAGYKIGHIEAGMRSYDKRMLEEVNRTVCDHCSDILFVYHNDYRDQLFLENIKNNVFVVGNTIVEPLRLFEGKIRKESKKNNMILMDIHRPENFNFKDRLENVVKFANLCIEKYKLPVQILYFKRLKDKLVEFNINLGKLEMIDLMPYEEYLTKVYHSKFLISDSGTGQEEPALLDTPVIVPRDFTERPQSYKHNCSFRLSIEKDNTNFNDVFEWLESDIKIDIEWLGNGNASKEIIEHINNFLLG
jgi:UDP-N-acetylglucosamine 2-epimerase (non-hydrolysing)